MKLERILEGCRFRYFKSPEGERFVLPFEGERCCFNVAVAKDGDEIDVVGQYPVLIPQNEEAMRFFMGLTVMMSGSRVAFVHSPSGLVTVITTVVKPDEEELKATIIFIGAVTEAAGNAFITGKTLEERVDLFVSAMKDLYKEVSGKEV